MRFLKRILCTDCSPEQEMIASQDRAIGNMQLRMAQLERRLGIATAALSAIEAEATPKANATVRRMAAQARAATKEIERIGPVIVLNKVD